MGAGASAGLTAAVGAASDADLRAALGNTTPEQRRKIFAALDLSANAKWLASVPPEAPLSPRNLFIVDAHHHLFPSAMPPFLLQMESWKNTMFGTRPAVERAYFTDELCADILMLGNVVSHTVHVECGQFYDSDKEQPLKHLRCVGETRRLQSIADDVEIAGKLGGTKICAGIVAHADLDLGAELVKEQLEAHLAAGRNVCGVRDQAAFAPLYSGSVADELQNGSEVAPDPGIHSSVKDPYRLRNLQFREGLKVLQQKNLAYDCFLYYSQLPQLAEIAGDPEFARLKIVCNHAGMPLGICSHAAPADRGDVAHVASAPSIAWTSAVAEAWRKGITALAEASKKNDNGVHMKLGAFTFPAVGMGLHTRDAPVGSEELASLLKPWVNHCIAAFGSERCMFESNFPMDKGSCSYVVLWNAFKRICVERGCSREEMERLFGGTAREVYGLT